MEFLTFNQLVQLIVATPGAVFIGLSVAWLLGWPGKEKVVARVTAVTYIGLTILVAMLAWKMISSGTHMVTVDLGNWFEIAGYGFPLSLMVDRLSLPMVALTIVLVGLVGSFSIRYLHRDPGYFRFFLLMHLYAFGCLLLFTAGSLDLLIAGWEVVGITSVLLIAFFQYRKAPVDNAIRVFGTYRIADICLLLAVFLAHHWFGSGAWAVLFPGEWPNATHTITGPGMTFMAVLLVFAACGKSSQGPFMGWLPRAMEGPTPSSAIFYGAISVHAGAYLVLRIEPLLQSSPVARYLLMFVGLTTAVLATLIHRTSVDAKTSLAYASMTQLSVIFIEVSLGWTTLAILHTVGHAIVRTAQFLRAPSMLHDYHRMHAAAGGHLGKVGEQYEALVPHRVQLWLYSLGLERGCYDALVDRLLLHPLQRLARQLAVQKNSFTDPTPRQPAGETPSSLKPHA
ncbi:MAG: hypothetical protein KDK99_11105 [Verrucomicrobiales bacterium]|nr:hypothetical protein [Verrucomicrobiales bacterium]